MGERNQAKGGIGGRQRRQAPPSGTTAAGITSAAQVQPPIAFSTAAEIASAARVQPPAVYLFGWLCKCCLRFSRGDARGEAPCIRKLKISPFPGGEGGRGDGGQKRKLKAGAAGNKEGKPPIAFSTAAGIASAAQVQPPLRFPQWQG